MRRPLPAAKIVHRFRGNLAAPLLQEMSAVGDDERLVATADSACSLRMPSTPSTGSAAPIAMNAWPFHCSDQNFMAARLSGTPGIDGSVITSCGKARTPAL